MEIDEVNYAILKLVDESDTPLWKNKLHSQLSERSHTFPAVDSVSVQTIGRRVDWLRDNNYLDSCIISPDGIKRDLIIAFNLTDKGYTALEQKEDELLQDAVQHAMFSNEFTPEKPVLAELLATHLDLGQDQHDTLLDRYTTEELEVFLTLYYLRNQIHDVFSTDTDRFTSLVQQSDAIDDTIYHGLDETLTE